jgi:YfiH family protein
MSFNRCSHEEVAANRRKYLASHGLGLENGAAPDLVHGKRVQRVYRADAGKGMLDPLTRIPATDAIITNEPGLILTTTHADCAPIYYYDPEHKAIGLAHAGWRGILAGIAHEVVSQMHFEFGTDAQKLHVSIGPTISMQHYEISYDIADMFQKRFGTHVITTLNGNPHLDL